MINFKVKVTIYNKSNTFETYRNDEWRFSVVTNVIINITYILPLQINTHTSKIVTGLCIN